MTSHALRVVLARLGRRLVRVGRWLALVGRRLAMVGLGLVAGVWS